MDKSTEQRNGDEAHDDVVFLKLRPQAISVPGYPKGFGHAELVIPGGPE